MKIYKRFKRYFLKYFISIILKQFILKYYNIMKLSENPKITFVQPNHRIKNTIKYIEFGLMKR